MAFTLAENISLIFGYICESSLAVYVFSLLKPRIERWLYANIPKSNISEAIGLLYVL